MTAESSCQAFHAAVRKLPRYGLLGLPEAPSNGVYVLFEDTESGHNGDRIVLIASHSGQGNLGARLREHTAQNKDRSILRKHIGRAMLHRDHDPYVSVWNLDLTSKDARDTKGHLLNAAKQSEVENRVSRHIAEKFSVSVLAATSTEEARQFKQRCVGTVSSCSACGPSRNWLGSYADPRIKRSGLWQVTYLYKQGLEPEDLLRIEQCATRSGDGAAYYGG